MSLFPVPDLKRPDIYALSPDDFLRKGIRFLLLDIDNTLAPYTQNQVTDQMRDWVSTMRGAGLELFILSNNRGERPAIFGTGLGLPYRKTARKPFPKKARAVMAERGFRASETAFIGDQIYTDTACAKWSGAYAVLVHPIAFTNPWLRLRYWLEFPFHLAYLIRELAHSGKG